MKTISLVSILILVFFIAFAATVEAQIPKQGSTSYTAIYAGTWKAVGMGQDRYQMTYEHTGAMISDTGEGIFHNATFHCIGSHSSVNGNYDDDSGLCTITCLDGDKAFFTYKASGNDFKGGKQTNTLVGGTGKLAGLQGGAEATRIVLRASGPPASQYQGPYQGLSKSKGQYKLP
jgi:hypothetical protein